MDYPKKISFSRGQFDALRGKGKGDCLPGMAWMLYMYLCFNCTDKNGTVSVDMSKTLKDLNISRASYYRSMGILREAGLITETITKKRSHVCIVNSVLT